MAVFGFLIGIGAYFVYRSIVTGFYTVSPNERAVITVFGKAQRLEMGGSTAEGSALSEEEKERYNYPVLKTIPPGGPYFKWPWMKVHKVDIQTQALDLTWDPTKAQETIEAVTKDNLTIGVDGQIRFRVSENNLYPYLFGVRSPLEHVMGFFISVLRERIANFTDPKGSQLIKEADVGDETEGSAVDISEGVSINDLRKNLPLLNDFMEEQCRNTPERYGIELDAALITEIDPPSEVDSALSSINSTRNQVAADISTARADAEQQITMSNRAVEIASNNAHAEVAPLNELARTLMEVKEEGGSEALKAYVRNMQVPLLGRAGRIVKTSRA
jgi:regulator of protease activity HflC (stomatin/prohibitin superfamily)